MHAVNVTLYPPLLEELLKPLLPFLNNPNVLEISINRPGEIWVEIAEQLNLDYHIIPMLDANHLRHLAFQIAGITGQSISTEKPLLSARLPTGERVQIVFPPVAANGIAYAFRKHTTKNLSLENYEAQGFFAGIQSDKKEKNDTLSTLLKVGKTREFFKQAVLKQKNILISGNTSSGKTTFARALLDVIPPTERLITIEDTQELNPKQPNSLALIASKGEQGTAQITIQDLLEAALRLRPDRILLGELRGSEAYSFLRAVNTGHPGTITTIHANNPKTAFEQLAMMVMQARLGLTKQEIIAYISSIIDIVVQLDRINGLRRISAIQYGDVYV